VSAKTASARAWDHRGYDDAVKGHPSRVETARARGGDPAVAAYRDGYQRGQRYLADPQRER
jgi:hypothetical protein